MAIEQTVETIWQLQQRGEFFPEEWRGKLSLDDAYRVQLGLLDRKLAQGERQAGWKVGLTADAMREMFGGKEPVFGHLLESASLASGHSFRFAEMKAPMVENELLVTLARDLPGPDATALDAEYVIGSVAPAFEIVELRGADMRVDLPLAITGNVAQRAFVHGTPISYSDRIDFGEIRAAVRVNGEVKVSALGREVIDNQLRTIAWLANALHRYGRRLQAGQRIMTGSFTKPLPVAAGDRFETEFSGVGSVSATFVGVGPR
jgi:2-keto-4-pentenoate hydratase